MTKAQYEAYGAIDELQAKVGLLRNTLEQDWRVKRRYTPVSTLHSQIASLSGAVELLESAVKEWEAEDPNALSVDALLASRVQP